MELSRSFQVRCSRDEAVERLAREDLIRDLLPGDTELVASKGERRTTRTRYVALGVESVVTFHFTTLIDGNLRFEKECDGRVWRELRGAVEIEDDGDGARVELSLKGRTKALVPEFTIKAPMEAQIEQMVEALARFLDA